jgi:peptidoglycan/LPS O-acetylase OafA/YrhL
VVWTLTHEVLFYLIFGLILILILILNEKRMISYIIISLWLVIIVYVFAVMPKDVFVSQTV